LQCDVVGERLFDSVHVIILGLQQKGRRRVGANADVRTKAQVPLVPGGVVLILAPPTGGRDRRRWRSPAAADASAASTGG